MNRRRGGHINGLALRRARIAKGMTYRDVCAACREYEVTVDPSNLARAERNLPRGIGDRKIAAVAKVLGVPITELVPGQQPEGGSAGNAEEAALAGREKLKPPGTSGGHRDSRRINCNRFQGKGQPGMTALTSVRTAAPPADGRGAWYRDVHRLLYVTQGATGLPVPFIGPDRASFYLTRAVHAEDTRRLLAAAERTLGDALGLVFAARRSQCGSTRHYILDALMPSGLVVSIVANAGHIDGNDAREAGAAA